MSIFNFYTYFQNSKKHIFNIFIALTEKVCIFVILKYKKFYGKAKKTSIFKFATFG